MRRMLTPALGLAAAVITLGPFIPLAGAKRPARQAPERVFTVFDFGHNGFIPAPGSNPRKPSPGDEIIVNGHLTLPFAEHGKFKIIGHDTGTCTLTRVGRHGGGLANCTVTAVLPHGSITTEGQIKFGRHNFGLKTSHLAITGGTGEFRGASGAMQVAPRGHHHNALTFTVR
jgi:hypothetical protein